MGSVPHLLDSPRTGGFKDLDAEDLQLVTRFSQDKYYPENPVRMLSGDPALRDDYSEVPQSIHASGMRDSLSRQMSASRRFEPLHLLSAEDLRKRRDDMDQKDRDINNLFDGASGSARGGAQPDGPDQPP